MQLSARNQLEGKVAGVELGAVMANVKIEIAEPGVITALLLLLLLKSLLKN